MPGTINVTERVNALRQRKLHKIDGNPIGIVKNEIYSHFNQQFGA